MPASCDEGKPVRDNAYHIPHLHYGRSDDGGCRNTDRNTNRNTMIRATIWPHIASVHPTAGTGGHQPHSTRLIHVV